MLHGRGDTSAGFRWLPGALELPGVHYLLTNAPDPYYGGRSWYDLPPNQAPGVERSRGLLTQLFQEVVQQGQRPENTLLLGFSQGCLMTLDFGSRSELPLAGYVGISGYCLDPEALLAEASEPARRGKWLLTHGRFDEVLPFDRSQAQYAQLSAAGMPLVFREYDKGHTIDLETELDDIRNFIADCLGLDQ